MSIVASPRAPAPIPPASPSGLDAAIAFLREWQTELDCAQCAQWLAREMSPVLARGGPFILELRGTLGAGKTTFTRHLLRSLGVSGRIKSPSYAVVEPHEALDQTLWHFDFYRFSDPSEWEDAGLRDVFAGPGLKVVEWPDHAAGLLPPADLKLGVNVSADAAERRTLTWEAATPLGHDLIGRMVNPDSCPCPRALKAPA